MQVVEMLIEVVLPTMVKQILAVEAVELVLQMVLMVEMAVVG